MSEARESILASLARARPPAAPQPPPMAPPPNTSDPLATLQDRLEASGGRFQLARRGAWLNQIEWPVDLTTSRHVYSAVDGLESRGHGRTAREDRELEGLELCVLHAEFAVVENGACWHLPRTPRDRVAALLATHLVLVVEASEIVPTLHQAYARIDLTDASFGWFLCGPSKTADIEQALVLGAHGACTMNLVVLEG